MMQACRAADISYQTLKFYCNEGPVPNVKRDRNNRRIFDEHDVNWIKDLVCLRKCGMRIQEKKEYLALCLQGQPSIPQRKKNAGTEAESLAGLHPGVGRMHRLYRLEAGLLRRSTLRRTSLCQQPDSRGEPHG